MPEGVSVVIENGFATVDFLDRRKRGPALAAMLAEVGPDLVSIDTGGPRKRYVVPINAAEAAGLIDGNGITDADRGALDEWLTAEREYTDRVGEWLDAEAEHVGAVEAEQSLTGVVEPVADDADADDKVEKPKLTAEDFKPEPKRPVSRRRSTSKARNTAAIKATEPDDEGWG